MVLSKEASTSGDYRRRSVGGGAGHLALLGKFARAKTEFRTIRNASFLSFDEPNLIIPASPFFLY